MINNKRLKRAPLKELTPKFTLNLSNEQPAPNIQLEDLELILKTIVQLCKQEHQRYGFDR